MQVKLSIITVCYNKWNFTKSCLKDLLQLNTYCEIIIVDNASTDETKIELEKLVKENNNLIYIRNEENIFHSKACNQGARIANGEYILFLNNDIRIRSNYTNWIDAIINACNSTNGLVGPTMGQLDNNMNFVREANQQLSGNCYLGGWCVAAKREIWHKLDLDGKGQIWNEVFPFYFNDTDLSFRARKLQVPLTVVNLPELVHFGKISAAQINVPKLYKEGRSIFLKQWMK